MSALVERIIAARDGVKRQDIAGGRLLVDVLADAANALVEKDREIRLLTERLDRPDGRHRASFGLDE